MSPGRFVSPSDADLPKLVSGVGCALLFGFVGIFFWFNGLSVRSITSLDFVMGLSTTGPFNVAIVYGGYRLWRDDVSPDRYDRIVKWFAGGLLGFLLLNVAMILAWPADTLYSNVAWAEFAASAGGAAGLAIGIFEGRAIDRAVAVERSRFEREELKRRNDKLEEFASVVSHDLRNPLSVATGRLELVREEPEAEHIDAVASAHDRMKTIIDRTLTLARSGQIIGETEPVELDSVVSNCWGTVSTSDAALEVAGSATLEADPTRLRHLFENLFRNAVEHGGEDVTVRVGVTEDGFYVEDDGPGVPEKERDGVFEIGRSTNEEGTGFGLNIVRQVAEAHGWQVGIAEGTDGGARIEVSGVEFAADRTPVIR